MPSPAKTHELSPAKRRQILEGARSTFGELGFERASVDLVASRAGVSKATVYNHFEDKKALFTACFSEEADEMRAALLALLREPEGDLEDALQRIGEETVTFTLSPAVEGLYRHTIAEAARFPEVGRRLFDRGPRVVQDALAAYLRGWDEKGALRIEHPRFAAVQFASMCQGDLMLRTQLGMRPAAAEIRDSVRRAVRAFLRAYRA